MINKKKRKRNEILLINASKLFSKGRPKNFLPDETIQKIYEIYSGWNEENGISKIITKEDAIKNDYNLSPSRYVSQDGGEEVLPLEEAIVLVKEAKEERREAEIKLHVILREMGLNI